MPPASRPTPPLLRRRLGGLGRRRLASLGLVALLGGVMAACSAPSATDSPVRVGYSAWPGWFPWKVAEAKQLFDAKGVPVTLQWFDGYLDSINALNAGQLDCNSQTLGDTISSIAGGASLQVVLTNDNSTGNDQIIVAEGITSIADLKGKKVAAEEGTVDHYLLLLGLKSAGLSADDIEFVPLETGAASAAFVAGQVDAVGVFAPFTTQALKREGSTTLFSSKDFPGAISDHLVCRSEFVAENPEKVQKLVDTWFATLATIQAEPAESLKIMSERAGVSEEEYKEYDAGTTILTLEQNREAFKPGTTFSSLPYAAEQISAFLVETGLAETPPDLDGLLQGQFVDAVK
jgi:NitT/TauT family transport system substrate-binding protein